jgi:expansin
VTTGRPTSPALPGWEDPPAPAGPGRRDTRRRWLAPAGIAALAALVGVALAVRAAPTPACAAVPRAHLGVLAGPPLGGTVHTGKATFYDVGDGGGNCSRPNPPANRLYVALGPDEYAAGAACGGFLDVTGPNGTVRVLVMDQCPECEPGHLDLSAEAFARIAAPVQGIVKVSYRAVVDPPLPGPLTFRMKEGSSQWWFAVLVGDHGNPLRSVEVRTGGAWHPATRQDYNYWLIDSGAGPGPYRIRVTDAYGHRANATGIRLLPGQTQRSTARMYGPAARATAATRAPSSRPSPRPSRTAGPSVTPAGSPTILDAVVASPLPAGARADCG